MDEQRAILTDGLWHGSRANARKVILTVDDHGLYYIDPRGAPLLPLDGELTEIDGWGHDLDGPARTYITPADGNEVLVPMNTGLYVEKNPTPHPPHQGRRLYGGSRHGPLHRVRR